MMARIVPFRRPLLDSKPSSPNWSTGSTPQKPSTGNSRVQPPDQGPKRRHLGDKLQLLAALKPEALHIIENVADEILRTLEEDRDALLVDARLTGTDTMKPRSGMRVVWQNDRPVPGWNSRVALANPRTPSAPATLDLTLEEYFAAAALVGILSAQEREPDMDWAAEWAHRMGGVMAAESRKRRRKR